MNIQLKHLELHNFMGANQNFDFSNNIAIYGANASGKTRIVNAWTFLLFGKDAEDRKDFNIKTLDSNNEPLHRVDSSIMGILSTDGIDTRLERIYKEKWIKKRGEELPEFAGHETLYLINKVPVQQKDYNEHIESILPESLFKQITNPAYFNSMKWTDRRTMLFKIAGDVKDSDVIVVNSELKAFLDLLAGKTFDKFKSELSAKIKLLKESKVNIPARIDEVSRAIIPDPDYKQVQIDIDKHNARLIEIEKLINYDAEKFNAANKANQDKQNKVYELKHKIQDIEFDDRNKAAKERNGSVLKQNKLSGEIANLRDDIASFQNRINQLKIRKTSIDKENDSLRQDWTNINESVLTFNENEFKCPACNRTFETEDIEAKKTELTTQFNKNKSARLESITSMGKKNAEEITGINEDIIKLTLQITGYSVNIEAKQKEYDSIIIPEVAEIIPNPQIKILQDEILTLEGAIIPLIKTDNKELIQEKAEINNALNGLKSALNVKTENKKHLTRKQELIDQEKDLSQQIANLEKQEFQCELFTRTKVDMIEEKVNGMFFFVKFKMFNRLVNGGIEECCDCLINGVPYPDANNAARINAGIDIINTLSKFYDVYAPIFVDNAEAVNEILQTDSQMIKLFVTTDKELVVKNL